MSNLQTQRHRARYVRGVANKDNGVRTKASFDVYFAVAFVMQLSNGL
jgi:hypothetical protein